MEPIVIAPSSKEPVYKQIYNQLRNAITGGEARAYDKLPTVRSLSRKLSVSHLTVYRAYQELAEEQLIELRHGSGAYVAPIQQRVKARQDIEKFLSQDALTEFEEAANHSNVDSLATLTADIRLFDPSSIFEKMLQLVKDQPWILGMNMDGNMAELRNAIADWMTNYGVQTEANRIVPRTNPQFVGNIVNTVFQPGDHILLEQPNYLISEEWLSWYNLTPVAIPRTPNGPDLEFLQKATTDRRIKGAIVSPSFGFGTGESWSSQHRKEFLGILSQTHWKVIESFSRGPLAYHGIAKPLIAENPEAPIFTGISLAETLAPGLRFGWIITPQNADSDLLKTLKAASVSPMRPLQVALTDFISSGQFDAALKDVTKVYEERFNLFQDELHKHLPLNMAVSEVTGGYSCFLNCQQSLPPADTFQKTLEANCPVMPGVFLGTDGHCQDLIRMNFGTVKTERIPEVAKKIAEIINSIIQTTVPV